MKPEGDHLLDDVLTEAEEFPGALLDETLRAVRQRRRLRRSSRGLAVLGVLAVGAAVVWNTLLPARRVEVVHPALHIVSSRPLPSAMIVATRPGGLTMVTSSPKTHLLVETGSINDPFKEINDEQLLALADGRPAALVRHGPHQAELIFLNPDDEHGFPVH